MGELRAGFWVDEWTDQAGVYVFGTHDVTAATPVALREAYRGYRATSVEFDCVGRWRLVDGDDPVWVEDPQAERAVRFTADGYIDEPEEGQ